MKVIKAKSKRPVFKTLNKNNFLINNIIKNFKNMKTIRNFRIILLLISGMLFFNSCDNFNKQLRVEDLNNHQFLWHKQKGGKISPSSDKDYSYTLPEDAEGKYSLQFTYNTKTMKYSLKFFRHLLSGPSQDFNGTFIVNKDKNMIILDDDLFFTTLEYSIDLREKVTEYGLFKKHIQFNQDSTLTFEYISTDQYNYPQREWMEKMDGTMSKKKFEDITKKRLAERSSSNGEFYGYYYIVK